MKGIMNKVMKINFASLTSINSEQNRQMKEAIKQYYVFKNLDKTKGDEKSRFDILIEDLYQQFDLQSVKDINLSLSELEQLIDLSDYSNEEYEYIEEDEETKAKNKRVLRMKSFDLRKRRANQETQCELINAEQFYTNNGNNLNIKQDVAPIKEVKKTITIRRNRSK